MTVLMTVLVVLKDALLFRQDSLAIQLHSLHVQIFVETAFEYFQSNVMMETLKALMDVILNALFLSQDFHVNPNLILMKFSGVKI